MRYTHFSITIQLIYLTGSPSDTRTRRAKLVGMARLELTHLSTPEPKSGAAANYATSPGNSKNLFLYSYCTIYTSLCLWLKYNMEDIYIEYLTLYTHSNQEYKQTMFSSTATEFVINPLYYTPPKTEFVLDTTIPQTTKSKKQPNT